MMVYSESYYVEALFLYKACVTFYALPEYMHDLYSHIQLPKMIETCSVHLVH